MATIEVDGRSYEVNGQQNLLHVCLSAGLDIPYFCWHPALGSVGACRQCAVVQYRDEKDTTGRVVMSCMTPATNNARIAIAAPSAKRFRTAVIEWLMLNHPHDCPVCEEGGDCHLQDMTMMARHTSRRYRGRKRTYENQYLGPFIKHEMNRCITCYRCVRFYRDYAGGDDLAAFGSRNRMYFGRAADGVLENPFAGNLIEVCPTGVFTDKPAAEHFTRKWDLQSAPSICAGCAVGCNTFPAERYGALRRVHNRYHPELNGYFLCDRGRFGSGYVSGTSRLTRAGTRCADGSFDALEPDAATQRFSELLQQGPVVGIGSPRASLEANFALRALVGADNFCAGFAADEAALLADALALLQAAPDAVASIQGVEAADAVLILGEDVLHTAPRVALALRQAARNRSYPKAAAVQIPLWQDAGVRGHAQGVLTPCFSATPLPTECEDFATATLHAPAPRLAVLGEAIAQLLEGGTQGNAGLDDASARFVADAARDLSAAARPLIVSGTGAMSQPVLRAAGRIARALQRSKGAQAKLLLALPECNSMGATMLGGGITLDDALARVESGLARTLVVLENDLFRRATHERVTRALAAANIVLLDAVETPTAELATLVLPAATYVESEGTLVNYEGRAQRYFAVYQPAGAVRPAWRWLSEVGAVLGRNDLQWQHIDDLVAACEGEAALAGIAAAAPNANYRGPVHARVPRQSHRYSGRTAMYANRTMHEPKASVDEESPFAFSMEGANAGHDGALIPFVWAPGWNSNQAVTRYQLEVGGKLRGGDPGTHLLQPSPDAWSRLPAVAATATGDATSGFRLVPLFEIFGGDELSALSPPIRERAPVPYVVLNPVDAARLGVTAGDGVQAAAGDGVQADDASRSPNGSFEVRLHEAMQAGTAGFSRALAGSWSVPPASVDFARDPHFVRPVQIIARQ